jgi:hypothetical protein
MNNEQSESKLADIISKFFVVAVGTIYASGFLIVLSFLDRFGIRETGAEFWKARYIHIGILCVTFPLILNGTLLAITHLLFHGKFETTLMWQRLLPIGILVINVEILCFFLVMFTTKSPGTGAIIGLRPLEGILASTLLGVPAILTVQRILERFLPKKRASGELVSLSHATTVNLRWILVLVVACFDAWFFLEFKESTVVHVSSLALVYVGFRLIFGAALATGVIYRRRQETEGRRAAISALAAAILGPLAYLIVLAFSYGIFQSIPATRGGGDFTESPRVVFTFSEAVPISVAERKYFDPTNTLMTIPLVVIEESAWGFFVAGCSGSPPAKTRTPTHRARGRQFYFARLPRSHHQRQLLALAGTPGDAYHVHTWKRS